MKIFKLNSDYRPAGDSNKSPEEEEASTNIIHLNEALEATDIEAGGFLLDAKPGENPDFEEARRDYSVKLVGALHEISASVLTFEQFGRLRDIKNLLSGLVGKISKSAYHEWLNILSGEDLNDLLPILSSLTDADFQSRPAYAKALVEVIEKKDLEEYSKKQKNKNQKNEKQ